MTVDLEARRDLEHALQGVVASSNLLSAQTTAFLDEYDARDRVPPAVESPVNGDGGVAEEDEEDEEVWVEDEDPFGDTVQVSSFDVQKVKIRMYIYILLIVIQ